MAEPNIAFTKTDIALKSAPIRPEWILDGDPQARNGVLALSEDRMATTLVWECTAGRFRWVYDVDETIHILEGGVEVTQGDGVPQRLSPGDVVFFPAGSSAVWRIDSYVRKLAFFRQPVPRPLSLMLRAYRRAAEMALALSAPDASPAKLDAVMDEPAPRRPGRGEPGFLAFPLEDNRAA